MGARRTGLYDCGVDVIGASVCAARYFGSMRQGTPLFAFAMASKLLDLVMIYYFYRYVRVTFDFNNAMPACSCKNTRASAMIRAT